MGRHWSYDLNAHPKESFKIDSLAPIVPMYSNQTGELFLKKKKHKNSI